MVIYQSGSCSRGRPRLLRWRMIRYKPEKLRSSSKPLEPNENSERGLGHSRPDTHHPQSAYSASEVHRTSSVKIRVMDSNERILLLIILLSLQLAGLCLSDFIESPSSMTVEFDVDQTVVFRCRHSNPDALISWDLNGTVSRRHSEVVDFFVVEMGIRVDTLTVPVIPAYNNTEVVCSAVIDGNTEDTPAATLIITETTTTTTESPTTPAPTTTVGTSSTADFDRTPSPLIVAVEEGEATFYCQHTTCDEVGWRVNGMSFNSITSPHIIPRGDQFGENGIRLYSLSFETLLEFNNYTVECVAIFYDGSLPQTTSPTTLRIQDVPDKVKNTSCKRNHSDNHLITEWDPLPSLDLTYAEPDIVYRIELNKITCGQTVSMGEETVIGTSWSTVVDPHEIYEVIITPRNNVSQARDGGSTVMKEQFLSLKNYLLLLARKNSAEFKDNSDSPLPSYYTMNLQPLDGTDYDSPFKINTQREGQLVKLLLDRKLPLKRLWNVSVLAHDCEADTVVEDFELSTHDVQHISVFSPYPGSIRVTGDLVDNTDATGVLIVVSNSSDVQYIVDSPVDLNINVTSYVSTGGEYSVSVFALENGQPFQRVAALPRRVLVNGPFDQGLRQEPPIVYELVANSTGVCITCTFLESSTATDCVAVVHQRISQLNSSAGLMNIESSHKFTRSGDTASGCIEGVNLDDYQVGMVGITQISPTISSQVESSQVILAAILCTVIAIVVVVVLALFSVVIVRRRKMQTKRGEIHGSEIPSVYSEVKLPSNSSCSCLSAASVVIGTAFDCFAQRCTAGDQMTPDVEAADELPPPVPPKTEESNILIDDESPIQPAVVDSDGNVSVDRNNISGLSIDPTYDTPALPEASPCDMSQTQSLPPHYETPDLLRGAPDIQSNHPTLSSTQEVATSLSYINGNIEVSQEHTRDHTSSTANSDPVYSIPSSHKISFVSVSGDAIVGKSHTIGCVLTSTESGCPIYVETQVQPASPSSVPCPPVADNVLYDEVNGFQNALGQQYALLGQLPPSKFVVDDLGKTHTPYSEIKPQAVLPSADSEKPLEVSTPGKMVDEQKSEATVKSNTFTMEQLVDHLLSEASKWQALGTALSLDEDILDEIYTNNDRDEDCLRDMLERYMMKSDLKHNWEEINKALAAAEKDSSGDGDDQGRPAPAQETSAHIRSASTGSISDTPVAQCLDGGTHNTTISVHSTQTTPIATGVECDDRVATAVYQPENLNHATEYLTSFSPQVFSCCHEDSPASVQQSHICQETQDDEMDYMSAMKKTLNLQLVPKSTVTPTTKKTMDSGDHATPNFHVDADADQDVPSTTPTVSVPQLHQSTLISYDKSLEHMQRDGHAGIDKHLCDSLLGKSSNLQMILVVLLAVMVLWDHRLSLVACSNKQMILTL